MSSGGTHGRTEAALQAPRRAPGFPAGALTGASSAAAAQLGGPPRLSGRSCRPCPGGRLPGSLRSDRAGEPVREEPKEAKKGCLLSSRQGTRGWPAQSPPPPRGPGQNSVEGSWAQDTHHGGTGKPAPPQRPAGGGAGPITGSLSDGARWSRVCQTACEAKSCACPKLRSRCHPLSTTDGGRGNLGTKGTHYLP